MLVSKYPVLSDADLMLENLIFVGDERLFPGWYDILKYDFLKYDILKYDILKSDILKSDILKLWC